MAVNDALHCHLWPPMAMVLLDAKPQSVWEFEPILIFKITTIHTLILQELKCFDANIFLGNRDMAEKPNPRWPPLPS